MLWIALSGLCALKRGRFRTVALANCPRHKKVAGEPLSVQSHHVPANAIRFLSPSQLSGT